MCKIWALLENKLKVNRWSFENVPWCQIFVKKREKIQNFVWFDFLKRNYLLQSKKKHKKALFKSLSILTFEILVHNQQANPLLLQTVFIFIFPWVQNETFVVFENVRLQIRYRCQGKDTRPKVERTFIILLACSEVNFIMSQGCRKGGDR